MIFKPNHSQNSARVVALLLLVGGLWNSLWYGLRHLGEFWGSAGLATGIAMVLTAHYLWLKKSSDEPKPLYKMLVTSALTVSFLLYFITLVQLNLGYEIIH